MQQFFKFVFASCLGVFLALVAMTLFGVITMAGFAAASGDNVKSVESNSILEIKLEESVPELTGNTESDNFFDNKKVIGQTALVDAIEHAATDNKIKGIFINSRFIATEFTKAAAIRKAIEKFKQSGKFVYAYADFYSQGGYYLASVADSICLNPNGDIDFKGFAAEIPFMKDMFDRLDVKWQIYYAGQFKSATEPFRLDKMSDQNRMQLREYLSGMYDMYLNDIAKSRKIDKKDLYSYANELKVTSAHQAVRLKMVDTEGYYDVALAALRSKLGLKANAKIPSISLTDYAQTVKKKTSKSKNKIAVVYAEGEIGYSTNGEETNGTIDGPRYAKIIRKLRNDENVKAIVLRINSGGGSSLSSDMIWRELDLARKQGKVVVSSFGDYAASGGYYISCASDSVFAEPMTLTGSIGVFSMIPSLQKTFKNKLGISFDTVKTTAHAGGADVFFEIDDYEAKILQMQTDSIYETFLNRVGTNRKMSRDQVHAIAQGRIWLGTKAKDIGLVDQIGGLNDAIAAAAKKAGISDYKTTEYPKLKQGIEKFIENLTGEKMNPDELKTSLIKSELGEYAEVYGYFKKMKTWKTPQMRVPYQIKIK
ncbi:MAG: signal peptide peptidase SppA [Saprospiraceae bacterium]|nr:signal peptide peptidase SppA [Saprospiraceae bacterium]